MSEKDINRWQNMITPREKAPQPWTIGGSWDMLEVQPIPDSMLAELAKLYHSHGCPWNCRSLPLSPSDREYMYLLYYSMQGLVARMRLAEKKVAEVQAEAARAIEIADEAMLVQLRSYGWKRRNEASEEQYLFPPSLDSDVGQEVREAVEWLQPRGYLEPGNDERGEFVKVLRKPAGQL